MMKIFVVSELPTKQYVLESNVDGIALTLYASNILMGDTYNSGFMADVRNEIKLIGDYGKKVSIGIIFGEFSTNSIFDKYPFVEFVKRHHKGQGTPKKIKVPVFYDEGYIEKIRETITWFAGELKKDKRVYDVIDSIKVTGCNESTLEMRATAQTWETATNGFSAYEDAAKKWLSVGYTTDKAVDACATIIDIFTSNFPDKKLVLPFIPNLNSFPCINDQGFICLPRQRPDVARTIINYSSKVFSQYTALSIDSNVTDKYVQVNQQKYGNPKPPYDDTEFKALIQRAKDLGAENFECFGLNILHYPGLFKK